MHHLRILHISDIHLRGPREDADFRRVRVLGRAWNPSIPGDSDAWEDNLAEVLADGPVDLVTFTGDLANWGAADEYPRATRFFAHLSERLRISTDRIFLVPGNHDIDRRVAGDAWTRVRAAVAAHGPEVISAWLLGRRAPFGLTDDDREQVLARSEAYRSWLAKDLGRPDLLPGVSPHKRLGYRATLADPRWPFPVQIIGLDSAWLAGNDADAGCLLLTTDQVGVLASDGGVPLPGFRLALVHHPLSMLADEAASRRTLCELGVSLLLRGHTHENDVTVVVEPGRALTQFAAGSLFEGDRGDIWQNAHLVIDAWLDDRGVPDHYDVRIRVWSREGFWHDDSGRYRAARGGRLRWPLPVRLSASPGPSPRLAPGPAGPGASGLGFARTLAAARVFAGKVEDEGQRREVELLLARMGDLLERQELYGSTAERQAQIAEIAHHLDRKLHEILGVSLLAETAR